MVSSIEWSSLSSISGLGFRFKTKVINAIARHQTGFIEAGCFFAHSQGFLTESSFRRNKHVLISFNTGARNLLRKRGSFTIS